MNDPMHQNHRPFKDSGRCLPVVTLLLLAGLLSGGCAATNVRESGDGIRSEAASARLPFPDSRRVVPLEPAAEPDIEPTVVSYPDYRDPLIRVNRVIFAFNDVTYRYLLIPLGKGYTRIVPDPVHRSVGNFFYNLKMPVYAVNHLLQLEVKPMGRNLLRFGINTTLGILGLFDPAETRWGLVREETDFEDTLTGYGAGYGVYLVLPIFGPSDLRKGSSLVVDHFLNPVIYLTDNPERTLIQSYDFFQDYAPQAERYETLRRKSEDPYTFFRNLYLQGIQRDVEYSETGSIRSR